MSTLLNENFDGVTAPALPTGWTWGTGFATTASPSGGISPTSSPNVLTLAATGTNNPVYSFYNTADGNGGDLTIQVNVNGIGGRSAWGLLARSSSHSSPPLGATAYWLTFDAFFSELTLNKVVSGTATPVVPTVSIVGVSLPEWYQVAFTLAGTSLSVTVQDLGNSNWLNSSGAWQAGAATAISATDSSVTGSGYFGLSAEANTNPVYFDDLLIATAAAGSAGTLAKAESHDVGSIAGQTLYGSLSKTEAHDSASIAGSFSTAAAIAATERHDLGSLSGNTPNAILTVQDGPDVPAITGVFTSGGTIAITEGPDSPSLAGGFKAGVLSATERGDSGSIAAKLTAQAALAVTERRDSGSIAASVQNGPRLAGVEARDSASISGIASGLSSIHATERRDVGSILAFTATTSALAAMEAGDRGAILSVAGGVPPFFKVKERGDVAAILGGTPTVQYHVYANNGLGDPIDYVSPIATTGGTTYETTQLNPGTWSFAVRAFNLYGEEHNVDVAVTITIDADGRDVSDIPAPPVALAAVAIGAGRIRVEWAYPPTTTARYPSGFHVYSGTGGAVDYGSPAATATTAWTGTLAKDSAILSGLSDGVVYTFGVRAFNRHGEEKNTATVSARAKSTGPGPVQFLTLTATT